MTTTRTAPALNKATIKTLRGIAHALRRTGVASMAKFDIVHMRRLERRGLVELDAGYWSASVTEAGHAFLATQ